MRAILSFVSILVFCAGVSGCQEAAAPEQTELRPVRTTVIRPTQSEEVRQAIGEVVPRQQSDIGFRVSGKLMSRSVDVGDQVKKGDVLAKLEEQDFRNKMEASEADVSAAQAALQEATSAEQRQAKLLASGFTTKAVYDSSMMNLRTAKAKLESAQSAKALAMSQLDYTELGADFDGIVTAVGAEAGQVVNVGQMIVRLAEPKDKDAVFSVAESAFRGFKPGDLPEITVTLLSDPSISAVAVTREVSPVADPATRTYRVVTTLRDPPVEFRFGAAVSGKLRLKGAPVVVLPGSALFDKAGKPAVWVYRQADSAVELRPVSIATYETGEIVVSEGLTEGEVVVTAGVNQLREGQKVKLLGETQE